ncbi:hypothetical protein [Paraburkholderia heleia]|uniref:hypothetical protein n=1 Tax=Paraburkholderia heleia TaxID=634127 RepID=UPI0031CE46BF
MADQYPLADRQRFLDELSDVVAHARQHAASWEWDDREKCVAAAMNQYPQVKIVRIDITKAPYRPHAAEANSLDLRWERSSRWQDSSPCRSC